MKELNNWFLEIQRDFPWRRDRTAYRVWISEIMLQQTRAAVVIPYFLRWMEAFPDVFALANAPIEKVVKAWEGLGYYSRARNLHRGAKMIVEQFDGQIPESREELESIPGLGPYTVGAILSFGFQKRAAAVDGNVTRVICRYFAIEEEVTKAATKKQIFEKTESLLDEQQPWITSEALIELGATICTPKPRCADCPIQKGCQGQERAEFLPLKKMEKETILLRRLVLFVECGGKALVKKVEKGRVMADLYELLYFEMGDERWSRKKIAEKVGAKIVSLEPLATVVHTFTRYKATLYPYKAIVAETYEMPGYEWVAMEELDNLPFSSGHRKILKGL